MTQESSQGKNEFIYYRESALQSIVADVVMFALLVGAIAINHLYLGGSGIWAVCLFVLILIAVAARGNKNRKVFTSKEDLKKYINETL